VSGVLAAQERKTNHKSESRESAKINKLLAFWLAQFWQSRSFAFAFLLLIKIDHQLFAARNRLSIAFDVVLRVRESWRTY
jgi:hypothetical protein